ncbi:mediator of RNA polymerase II transcription subunit 9 [Halyomorpha halys]|uniref:mediator of RNA polymerase II transcription subunit 9 n=1 Tax=Halyomorpha halys TaxID=286706 RepID=UPI0006D4FCCD|nr:mediator of RNA polymerase II transcription subunit 9 [Halyomorpha halys]
MESSHENQDQHANDLPARLSVEDVDVDFLPIIYDIIRGLEKDPHESSQKPSHSQDISQKVLELHKKLELAKEQIKRLPGVEYSKEQQLDKLEALRTQLKLKRDLLLKYRTMCTFDIPKA